MNALQDSTIDKFEASVKYPFNADAGSENEIEHIWVTNISQERGHYFGIVANDPFYIKGMKLGDRVEFDISKISDWKYVKDGYMIGGKSIKYFYDKMSEKEKMAFDEQSGFKFKE